MINPPEATLPLSSRIDEEASQKLAQVVLENAATEEAGIRILNAVREFVEKLRTADSRSHSMH